MFIGQNNDNIRQELNIFNDTSVLTLNLASDLH